jgi:hypothetical protein
MVALYLNVVTVFHQDLKQNFMEIQHREKAAREESKMYQRQLNDVSVTQL